MLNVERIQNLLESYSIQEMMAAMVRTRPLNLVQGLVPSVYQHYFNEFDGREVVGDLARHNNLWRSFFFSRPIYNKFFT